MSNHFHLVVAMVPSVANAWSPSEIAARWCRLFPKEDAKANELKIQTLEANEAHIMRCRARLHDLSWLMKMINEPIARRANAEDRVNGRFWQG